MNINYVYIEEKKYIFKEYSLQVSYIPTPFWNSVHLQDRTSRDNLGMCPL